MGAWRTVVTDAKGARKSKVKTAPSPDPVRVSAQPGARHPNSYQGRLPWQVATLDAGQSCCTCGG